MIDNKGADPDDLNCTTAWKVTDHLNGSAFIHAQGWRRIYRKVWITMRKPVFVFDSEENARAFMGMYQSWQASLDHRWKLWKLWRCLVVDARHITSVGVVSSSRSPSAVRQLRRFWSGLFQLTDIYAPTGTLVADRIKLIECITDNKE